MNRSTDDQFSVKRFRYHFHGFADPAFGIFLHSAHMARPSQALLAQKGIQAGECSSNTVGDGKGLSCAPSYWTVPFMLP